MSSFIQARPLAFCVGSSTSRSLIALSTLKVDAENFTISELESVQISLMILTGPGLPKHICKEQVLVCLLLCTLCLIAYPWGTVIVNGCMQMKLSVYSLEHIQIWLGSETISLDEMLLPCQETVFLLLIDQVMPLVLPVCTQTTNLALPFTTLYKPSNLLLMPHLHGTWGLMGSSLQQIIVVID